MRAHSTISWVLGVITIFSAASVGAQPRWGRPSLPRDGACFYRDQNYGGEYFCVAAGQDLPAVPGGMNNEITSIRTFGNVQVTIYREARFKGRASELRGDVRNVGDDWNDKISSMRVRPGFGRDGDRGRDRNRDRDRNNDRDRDRDDYRGRDRDDDRRDGRVTDQQAEAMVARAYRTLLERDPDPASRGWVDLVKRNNWTEQQLADEIMKSDEYIAKHSRRRR
jgi:hypothetical protein